MPAMETTMIFSARLNASSQRARARGRRIPRIIAARSKSEFPRLLRRAPLPGTLSRRSFPADIQNRNHSWLHPVKTPSRQSVFRAICSPPRPIQACSFALLLAKFREEEEEDDGEARLKASNGDRRRRGTFNYVHVACRCVFRYPSGPESPKPLSPGGSGPSDYR